MNTQSHFIDYYYQILPAGIGAFVLHVTLGGICFLTASVMAWLITWEPRKFYILRLIFMLLLVVAWWSFDFHRGYNGHPAGWGIVVGNKYGMQTIWAWLALALLARPKKAEPQKSATAVN